ncbi:hypothetical protein D3C80_2021450 [compost metagenome]
MPEAPARGDFADQVLAGRRAQQFMTRAMQADVAEEGDRVDPEHLLEGVVQGATADPQFLADFQHAGWRAPAREDVFLGLLDDVPVHELADAMRL